MLDGVYMIGNDVAGNMKHLSLFAKLIAVERPGYHEQIQKNIFSFFINIYCMMWTYSK
jgi:hypothetical protein